MRPHSGHKHTRPHPNFAQLGIHEGPNPQARGGLHPFLPVYTFENLFPCPGSHSLLRTEATGHPGNGLLRKSATGGETSRHKTSRSVATLPGLGRLHSQNVGRGIKMERIMQGGGSRGGDRRIRSDQENHQKPSRMPAYIYR